MPCVYNQAIRVAIEVDVKVVGTEEERLKSIVIVEGSRGSDIIVFVF
jgi:hypothetical protein